jgi:dihydrofolate reductase
MLDDVKISLILAMDAHGCIGKNNALPWRVKSDLRYFKEKTLGKPIIMGRKTCDSLGRKPLKDRANFVVTRDITFDADGFFIHTDLKACFAAAALMAKEMGADEIMVIGGAEIYKAALPYADRIYLTELDLTVTGGDSFFTLPSPALWHLYSAHENAKHDGDDAAQVYKIFDKIKNG